MKISVAGTRKLPPNELLVKKTTDFFHSSLLPIMTKWLNNFCLFWQKLFTLHREFRKINLNLIKKLSCCLSNLHSARRYMQVVGRENTSVISVILPNLYPRCCYTDQVRHPHRHSSGMKVIGAITKYFLVEHEACLVLETWLKSHDYGCIDELYS